MNISNNGLKLIKKFEGCKLESYKCAAGVWTIGYGHTRGVKEGQKISQNDADKYLKEDLKVFEKNVTKYDGTYHWNQNQFDALVSFAFNIGSIDQLTAKGTRSISEISKKIPEYNKAGGKVLAGLTERRKEEKKLFDKPFSVKSNASASASASVGAAQKFDSKYKNGKSYEVCANSGLHLRKGAGKDYASLGVLPLGSKVTWYGYYSVVNGTKWLYVRCANGKEGFVCSTYLV